MSTRDCRQGSEVWKQLTREIVQHTQRIQKVLEDANVKLSSVISDILGASGRPILRALIEGETDAGKLAGLGSERLKCSSETLVEVGFGASSLIQRSRIKASDQ